MTTTRLSGKEIVSIIKACKFASVARLKVGDFEVSFDYKDEIVSKSAIQSVELEPTIKITRASDDQNTEALERIKKLEEEIEREIEEANLILEDPTRWEQQALSESRNEVGL